MKFMTFIKCQINSLFCFILFFYQRVLHQNLSAKLYSALRMLRTILVKEAGEGVMAYHIFGFVLSHFLSFHCFPFMTIFVYENKRLYSVHKTSTFAWPKRSHGSKINSFDFLQFFQDAIFVFIHIYILLFVISIPFYFNTCPNKLLLPPFST